MKEPVSPHTQPPKGLNDGKRLLNVAKTRKHLQNHKQHSQMSRHCPWQVRLHGLGRGSSLTGSPASLLPLGTPDRIQEMQGRLNCWWFCFPTCKGVDVEMRPRSLRCVQVASSILHERGYASPVKATAAAGDIERLSLVRYGFRGLVWCG